MQHMCDRVRFSITHVSQMGKKWDLGKLSYMPDLRTEGWQDGGGFSGDNSMAGGPIAPSCWEWPQCFQ